MMLSRIFAFILIAHVCCIPSVFAQYKYGIKPVTLAEYKTLLKSDERKELVNLQKEIPGIVLDIKYATADNFMHRKMYTLARAYARKPVAEALKKVQAELKPLGLGIKIFDAYRPYKITVRFYEEHGDTTYVASAYKGSRHNRGCAIDMTLIDLKTGQELKMPTPYDSFQKEAWPTSPVKDPEILKNRTQLITVMQKHGFVVNGSEWWHYDFKGWRAYEILDIDFEALE